MKELLIGFVLMWFYLVLTVESKPYKQVNVYTNDSYSDTSGRIYGTIIDKKCNCTKVVKQALSQYDAGEDDDAYQQPATYKRRKATPKPAYSANMDEYEEEVYPKKTTPKKAYRKPVKPGCEDEEDSYGEPEAYPKKKATPKPKGYAATPEYTEEEEDYEPAPMRYPKKKVTPKPTYKKTSIYQETTAEEQYEEGDEYEEKPVKKAKPYKVAPKQPAYEEEEEEPEYNAYDESAGYSGMPKPRPKPKAKPRPQYQPEEEEEYEEAPQTYQKPKPKYSKGKNATSGNYKTGKQQYLDLSDAVTEEEIDPNDYVYKKPSKSSSSYKPAQSYKPPKANNTYSQPKPAAPAKSKYADDDEPEKIDYDIDTGYDSSYKPKPASSSDRYPKGGDYGTTDKKNSSDGYKKPAEPKPQHHMTTHHHTTHRPSYTTVPPHHHAKSTTAYGGKNKDTAKDSYVDGNIKAPAELQPNVVTVHQNASRETGILVRLIDSRSKSEPKAEYKIN